MTAGTTTIGTTTIERRLAGRRLTRRPAPHYSDLVKATVHGRLFRSHSSHTEDTHDHNAAHARLSPFARASGARRGRLSLRSEEHTSELQSLMRISYAVFCLNKNNHMISHPQHKHSYLQHIVHHY